MPPTRPQKYLLILILILLSFAIYANSLSGGFLVDDDSGILNNPQIRDYKVFFRKHFRAIPGAIDQLKRVFIWHFWGANPFPYHLFNVLVNACCVALVFFLCETLFADTALSFLTALIFCLHPIHTEAVSWIAGGPYALSGLLFIAAMIFYARAQNSLFYLALAVLSFAVCLFAGNAAAALPVMFLVYELFFRDSSKEDKTLRRTRLLALTLILLIAAMFIAIFVVSRNRFTRTIFYFRGPTYLVVIAKAFIYYLKILYLPLQRGLYHPFGYDTVNTGKVSAAFFAALFALTAALFLFFKLRKRHRPLSFGIAFFLVTYLPYSNIIPVCNIVSERYMYLPSAGFAIILAYLFLKAWKIINQKAGGLKKILRYLAIAALTLYLGSYAALTLKRNIEYSNIVTYWQTNINNFPGGVKAYNNLAGTFYAMGDLQQAIAYSWVNLMTNTEQPHVWANLGKVYRELGNLKESKYCYEEALKIDKNFPPALTGLRETEAALKAGLKKNKK
jgi:tetratricopeptide (TPR) repeat protein